MQVQLQQRQVLYLIPSQIVRQKILKQGEQAQAL